MAVPFIDLLRYESGFLEEVSSGVRGLLERAEFVGGPSVPSLEQALQTYTQAAHVVGCANGTDALQLALRAAGLRAGDRVLVPNLTFWASFEAVVNVGAAPVIVDISRETLHWTLEGVEEAIEKFSPRAAMLVHLYGWACPDTLAIRDLCKKRGVQLIEDSAQAFGVKLQGESLLASAEIATTSFYPAKVLGASGDAGAVFCRESAMAITLRRLVNHGRVDHYSYGDVGWNSRLGAYEATFLEASLKHLDRRLEERRRVCDFYRSALQGLPLNVLSPAPGVLENGYLSVIRVEGKQRDALQQHLREHGIGTGVVYPSPLSAQKIAAQFHKGCIDRGVALEVTESILSLPCFPYMKESELEEVVQAVRAFYR